MVERQSIGIVLNLSLLTTVTRRIPTIVVKEIIEGSENLIFINDYSGKNDKTKVLLNGILMGFAIDPYDFLEEMKSFRSSGMLNKDVSFTFDTVDNEIRVFCDEGRLIRPVFTVNNYNELNINEVDYIDWEKTCKSLIKLSKIKIKDTDSYKINLKDYIKYDGSLEELINKFYDGELAIADYVNVEKLIHDKYAEYKNLKWNEFVDKEYIQYVDNSEVENSVIAMDDHDLEKFKCNYEEIHPSMMLGVMGSSIPFPDHSQCIFHKEPVYMADGTTKKIEDVKIGDEVITFNPENQKQTIAKVIHTETHPTEKQLHTITTISGRKITATFDHRFMTSEGWKRLEHLEVDKTLIGVSLDPFSKNMEIDLLLIYEYTRYKDECDSCLDFENWQKVIKIVDKTLFLPIKSIEKSKENIISDITIDSDNQSFLCGDTFCVHNSPRNLYQSSMAKQAIGMYALSHQLRTDTITHILNYPQKPIVNTIPAGFLGFNDMPAGTNVIVAIACYTGFNQEDSVLLNKSAIERGLFVTTSYRTLVDEEKKQGTYNFETICLPPIEKRKRNVNYSYLDENGIVKLRNNGRSIYVDKGDVIIGKTLTKSNKNGEEEIFDCSFIIKHGEEGYIDRVIETVTPNGYKMVKVVIRNMKTPEIGDKFASRAA